MTKLRFVVHELPSGRFNVIDTKTGVVMPRMQGSPFGWFSNFENAKTRADELNNEEITGYDLLYVQYWERKIKN